MIELDDPVWGTLNGGYRVPHDASVRLRELKAGSTDRKLIWDEFFEELHHQGDVDIASYAAVPQLAKICIGQEILDWECFTLVAVIEESRVFNQNPGLPDWLETDYHAAIKALSKFGFQRFQHDWPEELTRSFFSVTAFASGLPNMGRFLIEFSDDELAEVSDKIFS